MDNFLTILLNSFDKYSKTGFNVQSISGYLYRQNVEAVIFYASPNRENTLVYAKPLQIFKGIDNKIRLLIKNQDQKLQNLLDTTIIFNLIDSATQELILSRSCTVITSNGNGAAYFILEEYFLNDLPAGIYNYSIKLITGEGEPKIIYAGDNYNAQGQARINDAVYPKFVPSLQPGLGPFYNNPVNVNFGYSISNIVFTDILNVFDRVKARAVLQTVQYYGTDFTGTIEILGSMEAVNIDNPSSWFTIDTLNFTNFTGCQYSNFVGKIGLVRFKITTDSGSLDKILYRP